MSIINDERLKETENKHVETRQARNVYKDPRGREAKQVKERRSRERGAACTENG